MTDPTATDDYAALLRGVLTDPAADLPRLVLADWLDENGHGDRAEFIRVQIESAGAKHNHRHHRFGGRPCEACRLDRRERELWGSASLRAARLAVPVEAALCGSVGANLGPSASFSRGFVSAVTLTQAAFLGGECDRCGGSGRLAIHHRTHGDCLACEGTGRTPGLAAALFRAHPIVSVTLSDARPHDCGRTVEWYRSPERHRPEAALCPELYHALVGGRRQTDPTLVASYATAGEATRAASAASVAYGREAAGLTALPAGAG